MDCFLYDRGDHSHETAKFTITFILHSHLYKFIEQLKIQPNPVSNGFGRNHFNFFLRHEIQRDCKLTHANSHLMTS